MSENVPLIQNLPKNKIVCASGEKETEMYQIQKGKLLVFTSKGSQITPLDYLEQGEYFGELSFFDQRPRSAHIITVEATTIKRIPNAEVSKIFPSWLQELSKHMANKIRKWDEMINNKGIRKKKTESMQALSMMEQRELYNRLEEYKIDHNIVDKDN